jgi:hypothetical protein
MNALSRPVFGFAAVLLLLVALERGAGIVR